MPLRPRQALTLTGQLHDSSMLVVIVRTGAAGTDPLVLEAQAQELVA